MKAKRRSAGAEGQYVNWLLAILVIAILLALLVPGVSAGWYRRNVTIDNTGGDLLTGYQVLVSITDHTHMDNGDSIRFTDTGNSIKYDYWIEEWDAGDTSRIWVEVPSVPAGESSEMYMWYGDSEASKGSNGATTFTFFDDFDNDNIDNWEKKRFQSGDNDNGAISAENNKLVVNATGAENRAGACTKEVQLSQGHKFEANVVSCIGGANLIQVINHSKDNLYENVPYTGDRYRVWRVVGGTGTRRYNSKPEYPAPCNPYVEYRSTGSTDYVHFGTNGVEVYNETSHWTAANFKLGFYTYNKGTIEIDWVFVRKYASPEPGTTVGEDEVDAGGGAPVPELPTVILFSVGLIVLAGYVLLRRREKEKGK